MGTSKILIALCFLTLSTGGLFGQGWQKIYMESNPNGPNIMKMLPAPGGGFLMLMTDQVISGGVYDFHIAKINDAGTMEWIRDYDFGTVENGWDMITTSDGGYAVLFETFSATFEHQAHLLKLDAQFNVVFQHQVLPAAPVSNVTGRKLLESNQVLSVFGTVFSGASNVNTGFQMDFDLSGNALAYKEWSDAELVFRDVTSTANGDFITTGDGWIGTVSDPHSIHISRFSASGTMVWDQTLTDPSVGYTVDDIIAAPDGGYIAVAAHDTIGYMIKIDEAGQVLWEKAFPYHPDSLNFFGFTSIAATADGAGYWAFGQSSHYPPQIVMLRLDLQGNKLWEKAIGAYNTYNVVGSAIALPDGVIAGGITQPPGTFVQPFAFRTDNNGNTYLSGISGSVVSDLDGDCLGDTDSLTAGYSVQVWKNGSFVNGAATGVHGEYSLSLDTGNYLVTVLKPNLAYAFCPDTIPVTVMPLDTLDNVDFAMFYNAQPLDSVYGVVFEDIDGDCIRDPFEVARPGWTILMNVIEHNMFHSFNAVTDTNGYYSFTNLLGLSTAAVCTLYVTGPQNDGLDCIVTCPQALFFGFPNGPVVENNIGVHCDSLVICPVMDVDIAVGAIRPCMPSTYHVNYCNRGGLTAENAYIEVTIDPDLQVTGSGIPWSSVNGNVYTFNIGDIAPEQCGNFYIVVFTPCDEPIGKTYCSEAHAYPDNSCAAPGANWDGSQIEVTAECVNGEVNFKITNIGTGDMADPLQYIVIEDNVLWMQAPFQLISGQSQIETFEPNGAFMRMEAEQAPGFPGMNLPAAWVEGCATGNNTVNFGFVNQFPLADEDPWLDVFCLESTNSYDPNDKQGFPRGYAGEHFIKQNAELEYLIRFQNTGTAPALQVELRDTIPLAFLDPATVHPGASSHAYQFDLQGDGVVVFKFPNINLPDTSAGDAASQGFVKFRVSQRKDLPLGTKIKNNAAIYFDANAPVITNQTLHTIGKNFILVDAGAPILPDVKVSVAPNPLENRVLVRVEGGNDLQNLRFRLLSAMGRLVGEGNFTGKQYYFEAGSLPAGIYFYEIATGEKIVATGKLTKG